MRNRPDYALPGIGSRMKSPIYTEQTICRDCYKCVRHCPVKAIRVNDGSAVIMYESCIFCGRCIEICPVNAKKFRSDTARARQMISLNETVIVSLAPSFPAEFSCSAGSLIAALKKLGFSGVSETSLGAEIVSRRIAERRNQEDGRIISSACPTVKELIRKYRPQLLNSLSDLVSPLEAHADMLKKLYGKAAKVVFIGPCISKKIEADDPGNNVDLALSFRELAEWFSREGINPDDEPGGDSYFIPENTGGAAEFAVEGGMLNAIKADASAIDPGLISCSGIENIINTFGDIDEQTGKDIFLEFLACEGGCISGKGMTNKEGYLKKRLRVLEYYRSCRPAKIQAEAGAGLNITRLTEAAPVSAFHFSDMELEEVLRNRLDKNKPEDEINCGGCGYNTCRDFAAALLHGKAEHTMCVTNMRKLAERKSNALMKAMPLGVVITDNRENIIECNGKFISLFTEIDQEIAASVGNRIENTPFRQFVPDCRIFENLRNTGQNMVQDKIRIGSRIFRTFTFKIGQDDLLGAVFQDITSPAVQRELLIKKTEEVIEKNLNSVQQIASLLGENAAETQLILSSIIESFGATS